MAGLRRGRTAARMRRAARRGKTVFPYPVPAVPAWGKRICAEGGVTRTPREAFQPEAALNIVFRGGKEEVSASGRVGALCGCRKGRLTESRGSPERKTENQCGFMPCGGASSAQPVPAGPGLPLRVPERWRFHSSTGRSAPGKERSHERRAVQRRQPVPRPSESG